MTDVVVIGAGPAGMLAALRAGDLGSKTTLVTSGEFGGMAANDGPVPVRALAHAARLIRDARQLGRYGINVSEPKLDYSRLLARVREVVHDVGEQSAYRRQIESVGVTIHEHTGNSRFVDPHTIQTESGLRLHADKFIICTGGVSRRFTVPGSEFTSSHSEAWCLTSVPASIIVVGAGATGVQIASVFNAFGSRTQLFQAGPHILPTEDEDVSAEVTSVFRESGIVVRENFGVIDSFEKTADGVRMLFSSNGQRENVEATLAVAAIGWVANTAGLDLANAGVELNDRGFIRVDDFLQTTAPHVFAAGDVTGRFMLVPQAIQGGFVAATNAVQGTTMKFLDQRVAPVGSFTDPEYAQVGLTETKARAAGDVLVAMVPFDSTTRSIIDGRTRGFCKLIVDRPTRKILGCHAVGERAVEVIQLAAVAMTANMGVDTLSQVALSFPTYAGVLGRVAAKATRQMNLKLEWQGNSMEGV
jgi:dihydrolipoamide dehydrogenase